MPKSSRDDFAPRTKETIARRSGYRCAFPNCRRLTLMLNPEDPSSSVSTGIGAHICAAASGGPRYDPSMTPEERASATNGIWLCASCSATVDKMPDAFSVDTLRYWKQAAERAAARDAQLTTYDIDGLIAEIDNLYHALISFAQKNMMLSTVMSFNRREPKWGEMSEEAKARNWEEETNRLLESSVQRKHEYLTEVQPQVTTILNRISVVLGRPSLIEDLRSNILSAQTNDLGVIDLAEKILELQSQLLYR
jgi:hypothetical protein